MEYFDGTKVMLEDRVTLGGGMTGIVVCNFDTGVSIDSYSDFLDGFLKTGVLVLSDEAGLVHYPNPDPDLNLVSRKIKS